MSRKCVSTSDAPALPQQDGLGVLYPPLCSTPPVPQAGKQAFLLCLLPAPTHSSKRQQLQDLRAAKFAGRSPAAVVREPKIPVTEGFWLFYSSPLWASGWPGEFSPLVDSVSAPWMWHLKTDDRSKKTYYFLEWKSFPGQGHSNCSPNVFVFCRFTRTVWNSGRNLSPLFLLWLYAGFVQWTYYSLRNLKT